MFAQMFSGMEWIPLMILSITVGLTSGVVAIFSAAINTKSVFARWMAGLTCFIGIAMPSLLLVTVGGKLLPEGYFCVAVPLVPALVAAAIICWAKPSPDEHAN